MWTKHRWVPAALFCQHMGQYAEVWTAQQSGHIMTPTQSFVLVIQEELPITLCTIMENAHSLKCEILEPPYSLKS